MTAFTIFVLFGLPVSLVALAWGAVFLHGRSTAQAASQAPAIHVGTAH